MAHAFFPIQFPTREILFSRCKLCLRYTTGNFNENPSMRALENFCEHEQASPHLIFASNSSKGQILRALPNWMEPFDTPITEKAKEELLERNSYCISSFRLHRSFEVYTRTEQDWNWIRKYSYEEEKFTFDMMKKENDLFAEIIKM